MIYCMIEIEENYIGTIRCSIVFDICCFVFQIYFFTDKHDGELLNRTGIV